MHEIVKEDKFIIISNGNGVIHNIHNASQNVTTTGQPFMILSDTEENVNDMFYSEWSKTDDELIGVPYPIDWIVGHNSESDAMEIIDAVMSVADFIKIKSIKHPDRDEWANPIQMNVISKIPSGPVMDVLSQILSETPNRRTNLEMNSDGWF